MRITPRVQLRLALIALVPLISTACSPISQTVADTAHAAASDGKSGYVEIYGEVIDNDTIIPAVDVSKIDERYLRQIVDYKTDEPVGTIIVDPLAHFIYLVMEGGKAMRYGVGVAKAGLVFQGEADILRKAAWPGWTPTPNMIKREPERYGPYAGGLSGGLHNPLGARALYLYKDGKDTLYRIHGTNEPWSIGKPVSSGCIRLLNQDILDLYKRVPKGARIVVLDESRSGKGEL